MRLLPQRKVRPQETPRASEVGDWLDRKIAALRREVEQPGESATQHSARGARRRAGKIRVGRRADRGGKGSAAPPMLQQVARMPRQAARVVRQAARSTRARGASITFYGFAIALGVLVGWIVVVITSRY
jgi:hypothetical protein